MSLQRAAVLGYCRPPRGAVLKPDSQDRIGNHCWRQSRTRICRTPPPGTRSIYQTDAFALTVVVQEEKNDGLSSKNL